MNPIILTAPQARELRENGKLELELPCEWQFGVACFDSAISRVSDGKWVVSYFVETHNPRIGVLRHEKDITPPYHTGEVVDIVEAQSYTRCFIDDNGEERAHNEIDYCLIAKATVRSIELDLKEGALRWKVMLEVVK